MKKWFLFLCLLVLVTTKNSLLRADSDYKAFQEIEIESGKFLSDFTTKEFNEYYKKVTKRRFWGWKVNTINKDVKVTYKTETLFSYFNDGTSDIEYSYKLSKKSVTSRSLSSTGSISVDASGPIQKFKGGLDASLKIVDTSKYEKTETEETSYKAKVDAGTMLNLYIAGEGKITNGVACNYMFWIRTQKGGFEMFVVTTQYQRLEKVRV